MNTAANLNREIGACEVFAKFHFAYKECTEEIQRIVDQMMEIVRSEDATADERSQAAHTVMEALFPGHSADLVNFWQEEHEADAELDREEEAFAAKVRQLMKTHGVTQAELAERIGVSQPAVSLMINRQCRPQSRTIDRIADAFGVDRGEIWPFDE